MVTPASNRMIHANMISRDSPVRPLVEDFATLPVSVVAPALRGGGLRLVEVSLDDGDAMSKVEVCITSTRCRRGRRCWWLCPRCGARRGNLLIAGKDIVAVDSVASFLMGIELEEVMTIRLGHQAGLGEMSLDKIKVMGETLDKVRMHWKRPDSVIAERFPQLKIRNKGACSGCNMNLLVALNEVNRARSEVKRRAIVMGQDTPVEDGSALIGVCTSSFWGNYDHLSGCPPESEAIKEFIS